MNPGAVESTAPGIFHEGVHGQNRFGSFPIDATATHPTDNMQAQVGWSCFVLPDHFAAFIGRKRL
jgi:hypothetical protein